MKKIIVAGAVSALAAVSFAGTTNAAPAPAACFGQVHKTINSGEGNVGDLVKLVGGQGKNAAAKEICAAAG